MAVRIFYLEDEPFLGKIVRESLESRGFEVLHIEDGATALAACIAYNPDICVLDVMMPNRDGFSVGEDIRRQYPALPIIFLTAKSQTEDVLKGFESGGNDYLKKPFSMEELIVRINNLIRITAGSVTVAKEVSDVLVMGKYRFSPFKQWLEMAGKGRQLSHREAQLLEMLASQPNSTISRKDILKQVWGNDSYFNSRTLDVYITRLREYLRDDDSLQILTLKGVGYRFIQS